MVGGKTENNLPVHIPEQQAVLIGWVDDENSDISDYSAYYIHWRGGLFLGEYAGPKTKFVPELVVDSEGRTMAETTNKLSKMDDPEFSLSKVGNALLTAYSRMQDGSDGKEAHITALFEHEFSTLEISQLLNTDQKTVESVLA